ncbi:MAG: acyl carrier protein [Anaerolineales bacterium]|nr:acyl carrier protein [Anaerolineales bacterium]
MQTEIKEFIQREILKDSGRDIASDEALISSGLIDSFSLVDIALFVEESYGVRIDDAELSTETFDTLAELAALVEQRR